MNIFIYLFNIYLQALSNLTGDPYRAHCSINRVPEFKFNNIYKVIPCPQKDNRIKYNQTTFDSPTEKHF